MPTNVPGQPCSLAQLTISADHQQGESQNSSSFAIHYLNRGVAACVLNGNPTVRLLVGGTDPAISATAINTNAFPIRPLLLSPGAVAASIVFITIDLAPDLPCSSPPVTVDHVEVGLPATAHSVTLAISPISLCRDPGIRLTPFIGPMP